jgi:peptidoglycan-N-acetylmuramic acid deacetylase PdaC-like protein/uncharacterized protein DUF3298
MKRFFIFLILLSVFSCVEEAKLSFIETNEIFEDNAVLEINIPKAEGDSDLANTINNKIENHIANILNFSEDDTDSIALNDVVSRFDTEYKAFKNDFEESALVWEALFDGEVTYQSSEIISIAINSYLNTGGAHGNMNVTFLNFNPKTGDVLTFDDLFTNKGDLTKAVKPFFDEKTKAENTAYFFGEDFHLPGNIGFNDEGIIFFYNVYEIASYADGITEFTIPFKDIDSFLKLN